MSENLGSTHVSQGPDRRLHPRQSVLLSCIQLEDDNGGIVLNVCEKGLAMQVVRRLGDNPCPKLRFQLSLSNTWIEARGRIAWLSNSRNTAGVELVEISDEARLMLKRSIAAFSDAEDTENAAADDLAFVKPARSAAVDATVIDIGEPENTPSGELVESSENGPTALDWAKIGVQLDMETPAHEAAPPHSAGGPDTHSPSETLSAAGRGLTLFSEKEMSHRHESGGGSAGSRSRMILFVTLVLVILGIVAFYLRHASGPPQNSRVAENGASTTKATAQSPAARTPIGNSSAPESPAPAAKNDVRAKSSTPPGISSASSANPVSSKSALPKPAPALKAPALAPKLPATAAAAPSKTIFSTNSGFILQVGAMKNQDNAVSLASLLRQKNFPAFVVKPASDPLYRVMVGPYSDVKSAAGGESELRKQGFQAIRKPNTPAQ